jgi:hypothetical protein
MGVSLEDWQIGSFRTRLYHPEDIEKHEERWLALTNPVPFETEYRLMGSRDGRSSSIAIYSCEDTTIARIHRVGLLARESLGAEA